MNRYKEGGRVREVVEEAVPPPPVSPLPPPQAEEMRLALAGGKTLTVRAEGLSDRAKYVRRVTLNGRRVTARALSHADLVKGGELVFEMADAPCDFAGQFQGHSK